ncbi:MAG: hypothetical protein ACR2G3_02290 [Solirubrobacterales bacterium]
MTRTRSLFAATLLALTAPLAIAACGGDDDGGGGDGDPQEVIDATLNNEEQITSGVMDLSVDASAGDQGTFTLSLNGPFQGVEDDPSALPQLDLTASVSGEGAGQSVDFEGGLVITEDNAFVEYAGDTYEVGTETFASFKESFASASSQAEEETGGDAAASFQEGCEQAIEAQGGDPSACDFDIAGWFTDLANDGTEDVGGTDAVHVSGNVDVEQMLDDIVGLASSIPNSQEVEQAEIDQAKDAITEASFDLYSGAEDDLLRGLDLNVTLDPSAVESAAPVPVESLDFGISFNFSEVNEDQTIEEPADAKPLDELLGQVGLGGFGALGGLEGLDGAGIDLGGGAGGGAGAAPPIPGGGSSDAYLECVTAAGSDPEEAAKCLDEL